MPEIVFVHCQTYSRKPNLAGQCVRQVIAEGLRSGSYHPHVEDPKPPVPVFGDPGGFQRLHDAHVGERKTRATKDGRVRERAIRRDRHTMFTLIASYPVPTVAVEGSPEELARFKRWVDLTLAWVLGQYGEQLKVGFAHTDEKYPHLHFWCLPDDPSADATLLHPGKVAKRAVEARLKLEGLPVREAVAAGNRALKQAMRAWQDGYHRPLARRSACTGTGPGAAALAVPSGRQSRPCWPSPHA
jgi:hypothetical protein